MAEPPITVRARFSDTKAGGNLPVTRVVIHATAGGQGYPRESRAGVAQATAKYFTSAAAGGSAHYICDIDGEEHCVPDDVVAFHAPPNEGSVGIEICADPSYTREQWLAPDVWPAVRRAAVRARELLDRFKLPRSRLLAPDLLAGRHGLCAHVDVSNAWHQSTHWDVGPNFPWPEFLDAVENAGATTPPAPILQEEDMPTAIVQPGETAVLPVPYGSKVPGDLWVAADNPTGQHVDIAGQSILIEGVALRIAVQTSNNPITWQPVKGSFQVIDAKGDIFRTNVPLGGTGQELPVGALAVSVTNQGHVPVTAVIAPHPA